MHEDVDDDDEDVVLDRRNLIDQASTLNASSNSGPILLGVNRFNIKVYDDPIKLSQTKALLLAVTCIAIVRCLWLRCRPLNFFVCANIGYDRWPAGSDIHLSFTTHAS